MPPRIPPNYRPGAAIGVSSLRQCRVGLASQNYRPGAAIGVSYSFRAGGHQILVKTTARGRQ